MFRLTRSTTSPLPAESEWRSSPHHFTTSTTSSSPTDHRLRVAARRVEVAIFTTTSTSSPSTLPQMAMDIVGSPHEDAAHRLKHQQLRSRFQLQHCIFSTGTALAASRASSMLNDNHKSDDEHLHHALLHDVLVLEKDWGVAALTIAVGNYPGCIDVDGAADRASVSDHLTITFIPPTSAPASPLSARRHHHHRTSTEAGSDLLGYRLHIDFYSGRDKLWFLHTIHQLAENFAAKQRSSELQETASQILRQYELELESAPITQQRQLTMTRCPATAAVVLVTGVASVATAAQSDDGTRINPVYQTFRHGVVGSSGPRDVPRTGAALSTRLGTATKGLHQHHDISSSLGRPSFKFSASTAARHHDPVRGPATNAVDADDQLRDSDSLAELSSDSDVLELDDLMPLHFDDVTDSMLRHPRDGDDSGMLHDIYERLQRTGRIEPHHPFPAATPRTQREEHGVNNVSPQRAPGTSHVVDPVFAPSSSPATDTADVDAALAFIRERLHVRWAPTSATTRAPAEAPLVSTMPTLNSVAKRIIGTTSRNDESRNADDHQHQRSELNSVVRSALSPAEPAATSSPLQLVAPMEAVSTDAHKTPDKVEDVAEALLASLRLQRQRSALPTKDSITPSAISDAEGSSAQGAARVAKLLTCRWCNRPDKTLDHERHCSLKPTPCPHCGDVFEASTLHTHLLQSAECRVGSVKAQFRRHSDSVNTPRRTNNHDVFPTSRFIGSAHDVHRPTLATSFSVMHRATSLLNSIYRSGGHDVDEDTVSSVLDRTSFRRIKEDDVASRMSSSDVDVHSRLGDYRRRESSIGSTPLFSPTMSNPSASTHNWSHHEETTQRRHRHAHPLGAVPPVGAVERQRFVGRSAQVDNGDMHSRGEPALTFHLSRQHHGTSIADDDNGDDGDDLPQQWQAPIIQLSRQPTLTPLQHQHRAHQRQAHSRDVLDAGETSLDATMVVDPAVMADVRASMETTNDVTGRTGADSEQGSNANNNNNSNSGGSSPVPATSLMDQEATDAHGDAHGNYRSAGVGAAAPPNGGQQGLPVGASGVPQRRGIAQRIGSFVRGAFQPSSSSVGIAKVGHAGDHSAGVSSGGGAIRFPTIVSESSSNSSSSSRGTSHSPSPRVQSVEDTNVVSAHSSEQILLEPARSKEHQQHRQDKLVNDLLARPAAAAAASQPKKIFIPPTRHTEQHIQREKPHQQEQQQQQYNDDRRRHIVYAHVPRHHTQTLSTPPAAAHDNRTSTTTTMSSSSIGGGSYSSDGTLVVLPAHQKGRRGSSRPMSPSRHHRHQTEQTHNNKESRIPALYEEHDHQRQGRPSSSRRPSSRMTAEELSRHQLRRSRSRSSFSESSGGDGRASNISREYSGGAGVRHTNERHQQQHSLSRGGSTAQLTRHLHHPSQGETIGNCKWCGSTLRGHSEDTCPMRKMRCRKCDELTLFRDKDNHRAVCSAAVSPRPRGPSSLSQQLRH